MVQVDFEKLLSEKSDEKLEEIIANGSKYEPALLHALINELSSRNMLTSEREHLIHEALKEKEKAAAENVSFSRNRQAHLFTDDESAPMLYSKKTIGAFSILFSVIAGLVLMSINIKKNNYRGLTTVILVSIVYFITGVIILSYLPRNTFFTLIFNAGGAGILTEYFWPKYIGNNTLFRKRAIWIPLIIALVITIPIVIFSIAYA